MLPLWHIQKHFVWLRIPVFLSLSLSVFLSVCVCKWERPQCLPAPRATLMDRWTVHERQTSLLANGKTGPLLSAWWQLPWVIASGPSADGSRVRPVSIWRWRVERAALASIPFTFPSGCGLPLCSWLHMAQRCPSGPWQPHAEGLQEFNPKHGLYLGSAIT